MTKEYNLSSVLKILYSWRKQVIAFVGAVLLISLVVVLIMPNYYQGRTIFYAASEDLFKPQKIFGGSTSEMYFYGSSQDINRILTIGSSQEFIDSLVKEFSLYDHYNINPDHPEASHKLREKFYSHFNLLRTKFDAIELTVEDKDPTIAANMANTAREQIEQLAVRMIKNSQKKLINSYSLTIQEKESQLDQLLDSLAKFQNSSGIYDPLAQAEYLSTHFIALESKLAQSRGKLAAYKKLSDRGWARDSIGKLQGVINGIEAELTMMTDTAGVGKTKLEQFNEDKGRILVMEDAYLKATNQLSYDKEMLKKYQSAFDMEIPAIHVLTRAEVPVVKSRPFRSIILLTALIISLAFCLLAILLIESYKQFDWKEITREDPKSK